MERICWPSAKISKQEPGADGKLTVTWRKCTVHNLEFPLPATCPACDNDLLYKIREGELRIVALEPNEEWPEMLFEGKRMIWPEKKC